MEAEQNEILPQEGTNYVGESLPDPSGSGRRPTYSGGGETSPTSSATALDLRVPTPATPAIYNNATWQMVPRRADTNRRRHKRANIRHAGPRTARGINNTTTEAGAKRIRRGNVAKHRARMKGRKPATEPIVPVEASVGVATKDTREHSVVIDDVATTSVLTTHALCTESIEHARRAPKRKRDTFNGRVQSPGLAPSGKDHTVQSNCLPQPQSNGERSPQPTAVKRAHSEDISTSNDVTKRARLSDVHKLGTKAISTDAMKSHLLIAVTVQPPANLSVAQAGQLQICVEEKIIETALACQPDDSTFFAPAFRGKPIASEGVLKMWCEDEESLSWLRKTVAVLDSPIEGTKLVVIPQSEIEKRVRASLWLPKQVDTNKIHHLLVAQNPWYNCNTWQLYGATQQDTGILLMLGIPESQVTTIYDRERRVSFLTGSVYLKFHGFKEQSDK